MFLSHILWKLYPFDIKREVIRLDNSWIIQKSNLEFLIMNYFLTFTKLIRYHRFLNTGKIIYYDKWIVIKYSYL